MSASSRSPNSPQASRSQRYCQPGHLAGFRVNQALARWRVGSRNYSSRARNKIFAAGLNVVEFDLRQGWKAVQTRCTVDEDAVFTNYCTGGVYIMRELRAKAFLVLLSRHREIICLFFLTFGFSFRALLFL